MAALERRRGKSPPIIRWWPQGAGAATFLTLRGGASATRVVTRRRLRRGGAGATASPACQGWRTLDGTLEPGRHALVELFHGLLSMLRAGGEAIPIDRKSRSCASPRVWGRRSSMSSGRSDQAPLDGTKASTATSLAAAPAVAGRLITPVLCGRRCGGRRLMGVVRSRRCSSGCRSGRGLFWKATCRDAHRCVSSSSSSSSSSLTLTRAPPPSSSCALLSEGGPLPEHACLLEGPVELVPLVDLRRPARRHHLLRAGLPQRNVAHCQGARALWRGHPRQPYVARQPEAALLCAQTRRWRAGERAGITRCGSRLGDARWRGRANCFCINTPERRTPWALHRAVSTKAPKCPNSS